MCYLFKFGLLDIVKIYNVLLNTGSVKYGHFNYCLSVYQWNSLGICGCCGPISEYSESLVFQSNTEGNFSIDDI